MNTYPASTIAAPQDSVTGEIIDPGDLASINDALGQLRSLRKDLLRASSVTVNVEPHHDYHSYACGRDWVVQGARAADAYALMGLHSLPPHEFCSLIAAAAVGKTGNERHIIRLQLEIIDNDRPRLEARGRYVSWRRRWSEYHVRRAQWEAEPPELRKHGHWRTRSMTMEQRELVRVTAQLTDQPMPGDLDRGGAHDWLDAHGANVVYKEVY